MATGSRCCLPSSRPTNPTRSSGFTASTTRCVLRRSATSALPVSLLQEANHFIPPALFARAAKATVRVTSLPGIQAPVNVAISNVPGSPRPLYCAGALQRSQYPVSGVLDGLGLNITVVSYRDRLEVGIVADREQLDDPWQLIAALTDALAELSTLTNARAHDPDAVASAAEARR